MILRRATRLLAASILFVGMALSAAACGGDETETSTDSEAENGANILLASGINADFEKNSEGWSNTAGGTVKQAAGDAHSGEGALQVETAGNGKDEGALTVPLDGIETGSDETYSATAWVQAPQATPMSLQLTERDAEGDFVDTATESFTATGDWQFVEATKRFGPRGRRASIHVYVGEDGRQPLVFEVDDVALVPTNGTAK